MSGDALVLWTIVLLVAVTNYVARVSFIALLARRALPAAVTQALKYVAVAMLTALVVPMIVQPAAGALAIGPRLPAAVIAFAVAFFTRSMVWTFVAGMASLWLSEAALAALQGP